MDAANVILVLVICTALAFDFTNGFHDTANAMAASISTGALKPKAAVALAAILNLAGAFLSVEVALPVQRSAIGADVPRPADEHRRRVVSDHQTCRAIARTGSPAAGPAAVKGRQSNTCIS